MPRITRHRLSWLLALVVLGGALAYGTLDDDGPRTDADRAQALARRVACPRCAGQSVAESDVTIARVIRADIAGRVDDGQADDEILAALESRYGEAINLTPSARGVTGLVWVLPVAALVGALAGLAAAFRHWRRRPARAPTTEDRELVEALRREVRS